MSSAAQSAASSVQSLGQLSSRLLANPLIPLLVAGAAAIAIVAAVLLWSQAPQYRVLFSNLSEQDGGRIISELESRAIPYEFSQGGRTLLVPEDQVYRLRLQLAEQGLPSGGNAGFEIMDRQAFGISQFAERVNFQRSLQGELASSIESLGPVTRARVHLSMAKPSVFIREREPAKASVVLTLAPGRVLGEGQAAAIVHLVSSSVPDLSAENVTLVDQTGRLLSRPGTDENSLDGTQLDYVHSIESSYQQRIERILEPMLGRHNVRAQVTAQVDFDQREETSERFAPNQDGAPATVRSRQFNSDYNGDATNPGGIPGALTNTPPGSAPSPIDATAQNNEEEVSRQRSHLRQEQLVNYEIDRDITHIQRQRGRVQRLSAAVVVNYREVTDEQGAVSLQPLGEEELQHIEQLVRQAMGYSEERGDGLEVVNSRFSSQEQSAPPAIAWHEDPFWRQLMLSLGRYLLVGLALLLAFRWLVRPMVERHNQLRAQTPATTTATPNLPRAPGTAPNAVPATADAEGYLYDTGEYSADMDEPPQEQPRPRKRRRSSVYEQNLMDLQGMAKDDPAMVAMIVRSWMNQDD
ncbi:flagellar basal-body MS-ring/collar protein FliF [Microbulbifer harenosus]|uniref:Flagellar M-ring protein n=1 Tax=Microbulbifer harenosus TaxID=2576840 RepID=A0ABY2UMZ2_9GAMM|nr:flagellar basal-body MS-ring/collar protein FliF [Microbulbifer harenosus]TLM79980.1 flagellar basal body M-ring protein FliF [Microbulbifer harenosus]